MRYLSLLGLLGLLGLIGVVKHEPGVLWAVRALWPVGPGTPEYEDTLRSNAFLSAAPQDATCPPNC